MIYTDKKSKVIFAKIIEDIKSNKYQTGELFPSEEKLCQKYNVGRSSVREALKALEILGIVEINSGSGTVLKKLSVDFLFQPTSMFFKPDLDFLLDLLEFRKVFEKIVLELVNKKITDEGISRLKDIIDHYEFYYEKNNYEKYSEYDFKFHETLALLTENHLIISFFGLIYPYLKFAILKKFDKGTMLQSLNSHKKIYEYIKSGDCKKALKVLNAHLVIVEKAYKTYFQKEFSNSQ